MARGLASGILVLSAIIGAIWWFNRSEELVMQQKKLANPPRLVSKEEEERMVESLRIGAPPIAEQGPHPKLVAEQRSHDFGVIGVAEVQQKRFPIKNEGTVPLKLVPGRTTCVCITGKMEKSDLAPGETTDLILDVRGHGIGSDFAHTFHVYSNDPEARDIKYIITGSVVMRIAITPGTTWRMGDLSGDQPVPLTGFVGSPLIDKFQILGIESRNPELTAKFEPASPELLAERRCKSGYAVTALLTPKFPPGKFEGEFIVRTDIDKSENFPGRELALQVTAARSGPLRYLAATNGARWYADTRTLFLGSFSAAEGKSTAIPVLIQQKPDEKAFEATEVQSSTPHLVVALKPVPDSEAGDGDRKVYHLTFTVPPGKPAAGQDERNPATVLIKTNHPELPELEIKVIYVSL
ncbi:MAG: DUF1573 domain-containing protein [Planctomycetaceae bacterium]